MRDVDVLGAIGRGGGVEPFPQLDAPYARPYLRKDYQPRQAVELYRKIEGVLRRNYARRTADDDEVPGIRQVIRRLKPAGVARVAPCRPVRRLPLFSCYCPSLLSLLVCCSSLFFARCPSLLLVGCSREVSSGGENFSCSLRMVHALPTSKNSRIFVASSSVP